jgi:DnaJ-class molecular chaperone
MDDDQILMRGGTQEDIEKAARMNGADLEKCLTCNGTGEVVENYGYCGGCEICGGIEEKLVKCPDCGGSGLSQNNEKEKELN